MGEATVLGQFLLIFRQVDRGRIIADGEARASRNKKELIHSITLIIADGEARASRN